MPATAGDAEVLHFHLRPCHTSAIVGYDYDSPARFFQHLWQGDDGLGSVSIPSIVDQLLERVFERAVVAEQVG